jgi:PadR family transcriptional regulator, regulatory protein PadR
MPTDSPRITGPTLKVLKELMTCPMEGLSGAEIARSTGLASGTLYPILFRLERTGWLCSHWEDVNPSDEKRPRKRLYRVTALGEIKIRSVFSELMPDMRGLVWQS